MPKCALNQDTDDPTDWVGTDDDNWLMRWRIKKKHWFAFANRCPPGFTWTIVFLPGLFLFPFSVWFTGWSWWYLFPVAVLPVARKWRLLPITLFAIRGRGHWRYESKDENPDIVLTGDPAIAWKSWGDKHLSRIQYYARWHFQIQWPFVVAFHWYRNEEDVPPIIDRWDTDGKLVFVYRGWHRDGDEIYWGDGGFAGTCWK